MPIAPLLQRYVDDELSRAPALIERCVAGTLALLRDARGGGLHASERAHHFTLAEALQRQSAQYQRAFADALRARVAEELGHQRRAEEGATAAGSLSLAGLELMDESRVEADIEISRAMQLIDSTAEWELRELQTFTSTLVGQTYVSADSNPLRPAVYAGALWDAACAIVPAHAQRAALLRVSSGVAAGLLKNAWAAASTRLEAQGVEPGVYRTVLLTPAVAGTRAATPPASSVLAALLASVPAPPRGAGTKAGAGSGPAQPRAGRLDLDLDLDTVHGLGAEFDEALKRLDEALQHLPPAAAASSPDASGAAAREDAAAAARRLNAVRAALVASAGASPQRPVVELLGRLFDMLLADAQLPAALRAPVARLQVPATRMALRDRELLDSSAHPLWRLLDRIGDAGAAWPAPDPRGAALRDECAAIADELARQPAPDASACRRALDRLDAFLAQRLREEQAAAQPAIEQLRHAQQREALERTLAQRIAEQIAPMALSPLVRRFMTDTWARAVAEAVLRFGEQSETTRGYIRLVDELLWSLQLPDHPQSRQRLVALLPGMLQRLRAGMALAGLPEHDQQAVLDELMTVHTEALRPGTRGPAELTPQQIVQRMRDEAVPETPPAQSFSDSVIDLASMQTVPAELLPADSAIARADDAARRVDALAVGTHARLFVRGRWQRVQLLWRSEQGAFLLFAGEAPGRTHSITRRALERLAGAALLQPLRAGPLVQRALDALTRELTLPQ